jgi:plasmid stabilization system protein ParE
MPKFILSEYVEPELDAIWEYIAVDNMDAADRFVEAAYGGISCKHGCASFARSGSRTLRIT